MPEEASPRPHEYPPVTPGVPSARHVSEWLSLMDDCEQFLLAGLRLKIGPDGDLMAAYRTWCYEEMKRHDEKWHNMARHLDSLKAADGR